MRFDPGSLCRRALPNCSSVRAATDALLFAIRKSSEIVSSVTGLSLSRR